jgi:hypothetical protein
VHRKLNIVVEQISEIDHQARLLVDGKDWLGPERLGLDPPMLEAELIGKSVGTLVVGRCWSGILGCHDLKVDVKRTQRSVEWSGPGAALIRFAPDQYDSELARFAQDKSWETVHRTVAREVGEIFRGTTIKGGFEFTGASTWQRKGVVFLSFRKDHRQRFLKFNWDGVRVTDAVNRAKAFRAARFPHCR